MTKLNNIPTIFIGITALHKASQSENVSRRHIINRCEYLDVVTPSCHHAGHWVRFNRLLHYCSLTLIYLFSNKKNKKPSTEYVLIQQATTYLDILILYRAVTMSSSCLLISKWNSRLWHEMTQVTEYLFFRSSVKPKDTSKKKIKPSDKVRATENSTPARSRCLSRDLWLYPFRRSCSLFDSGKSAPTKAIANQLSDPADATRSNTSPTKSRGGTGRRKASSSKQEATGNAPSDDEWVL